MVAEITTPTSQAFTVVGTYAVNPGLSATFPWLSSLANSFDKYRIHDLVIEFVPGNNVLATGNVMLSFDPNPSDSAPSTAVNMS